VIEVGDLAEVNPRTARPSSAPFDPVVEIAMKHIDADSGQFRPVPMTAFGSVRGTQRVVKEGDVLVAAISPSMENGKVAVATGLPRGGAFATSELLILRPRAGVPPRWLWAFFRRRAVRDALHRQMTRSTGRRRLSAEVVRRLRLAEVADADRDHALDVLDEVQACIDLRATSLRALRELPATVIDTGVTERVPLTRLLLPVQVESVQRNGEAVPPGTPFLRASHIQDGRIAGYGKARGAEPGLRLAPGDLLVARVGHAAVYDGEPHGAMAAASLLRVRLPRRLDPHYVWAWLRSPDARRQGHEASGQQATLTPAAFARLEIPLAPVAVQRTVGRQARELRLIADRAARQRDKLDALREAHLDGVFGAVEIAPSGGREPVEPAELGRVRQALAREQRDVWDAIENAAQAQPLSALASPKAFQRTRRTLVLLERLGIIVQDWSGDVEVWRNPDADAELLGEA
jgi:type I restriction enzyme S subunit